MPAFRIGAADDAAEREADAIADRVLGTPVLRRKCAQCEEEDRLSRRADGGTVASSARSTVGAALAESGARLRPGDARFFGTRLGTSLAGVRVHDGPSADRAARSVGARAFALGDDLVFARGEYQPETSAGRRLLAHELAHVVQHRADDTLRRTGDACPSDWETTVDDDADRGLEMIDVAREKLGRYDGTNPSEVHDALDRHFGATSSAFAGWIRLNLGIVRLLAPMAGYNCEDAESSGMCERPTLAWVAWCVPLMNVRVCAPQYFARSDNGRATTLIHEWVHKYGCNFDLGYEHEEGYGDSSTARQLINADPWAEFVSDVQ